jgi:tripartite-type tricarboxylate transporter receptor subunit TctC
MARQLGTPGQPGDRGQPRRRRQRIGAALVAKAAPDGYTCSWAPSAHSINQFLYKKLAYDPARDFVPLGLVAKVPNVLVVHRASPTRR